MRTIKFFFQDQLSHSNEILDKIDKKNDIIFLSEVKSEFSIVKHHKKKIVFIMSSMRHFADELRNKGFKVEYTKIDDKENTNSIVGEIQRICLK